GVRERHPHPLQRQVQLLPHQHRAGRGHTLPHLRPRQRERGPAVLVHLHRDQPPGRQRGLGQHVVQVVQGRPLRQRRHRPPPPPPPPRAPTPTPAAARPPPKTRRRPPPGPPPPPRPGTAPPPPRTLEDPPTPPPPHA